MFSVANSLDNFIAREDGSVDWLLMADDAGDLMTELWSGVDTVVMGRKTYEVNAEYEMPPTPGVHYYVFSRTLKDVASESITVVSEDPVAFVRELKNQEGGRIFVLGGGEFAQTLFEANLIDEVSLNVHPLLLGSGIPLFHGMNHPLELTLVNTRTIGKGCVFLEYTVDN